MKNAMKTLLILAGILVAAYGVSAKEKIEIKALSTVEVTYEEFAEYDIKLSNSSGKPVTVTVVDPATNKRMHGFGLGPMGRVEVSMGEGHILRLKNPSLKDISLSITFIERKPVKPRPADEVMVSFTLHNSSMKAISLIIPDVMNPTLSPFSNSGVYLKRGQKIYYKKGLNKVVLLEVDENISDGEKVDVAKLVRDLKNK